MDIDDPIRKLLSTTGWSCDDLLEKLQKFKSTGSNVNAEKNVSSKSPTCPNSDSTKNDTHRINNDPKSPLNNGDVDKSTEPLTVSNISSTAKTDECDTSYSQGSSDDSDKCRLKIISCISLAPNKSEIVAPESNSISLSLETGKSKTVTTTFEDDTTTLEFPVIANTSTISSTSSTQSVIVVNDDFSDTDEEEDEVNNTNSSIINEIIEDIDKGDNLEVQPIVPEVIDKDNRAVQTTEVTEVRVIEINSDDDDDDNFEDECYNPNAGLESSKEIQYLEVHPRHNIDDPPELVPEEINDRNIIVNKVTNGIGKLQTVTQNQDEGNGVPVHIEDSEDSNGPIDECYNPSADLESSKKIQYLEVYPRHNIDDPPELIPEVIDNRNVIENNVAVGTVDEKSQSNGTEKIETVTQNQDEGNDAPVHIEDSEDSNGPGDECYSPSADLESSKKKHHLEVHPRHNIDDPPELVPEEIDARNIIENNVTSDTVDEKSHSNCVGKIQIVSQNQDEGNDAPVHNEDSNGPIDNTDKIVIINDDVNNDNDTCLAQTNDSSNVSLCVTKTVDDAEVDDGRGKIKILDNYLIEPAKPNNGSSSPERTAEEENADLENLEDIRNNLKKQLSCLRTRKKEHFLKDLTSKVDNTFECNEKLANLGKKQAAAVVDVKKSGPDELYNQTYELGFVISSVQGGIELEDNPKDKFEVENNTTTTTIDPQQNSESSVDSGETSPHQDSQVCDEIRRIINKQKPHTPKIFINKELARPPGEVSSNRSSSFPTSSAENSQSSFILDQSTKHISPFVSNTLDEFLTGAAKLNISYNVPKCGAEDGLKENSLDVSPLLLKRVVKLKNEEPLTSGQKPENKLKAKTVAQKRKLLEMEHKRKLKKIRREENKLKMDNKKSNKPDSYVMMDGQKLRVKSSTSNTCIATINLSKNAITNSRQRKLSLLKKEKQHKKLKYLPGPLCKKQNLQMNGLGNWETQVRTLPKVTLEVEPRIGQPMCHIVRSRLPSCNGNITEDQIDFALSMLKTDTIETKKFVFPMHYRYHQEQIIIKKRKILSPVTDYLHSLVDVKKSGDTVADVVEGLIRYVEIKEIAPTLIKEEPIKVEDQIEVSKNVTVDEKITVFKKPAKRKSKIDMELYRLSCKVVNVEVEEKDEEEPCTKPFCRLGCVCKSIKCEHLPHLHCQKVKCMFECTCPKERHWTYDHKFTLPAGSNVLATDTVSRIEDEAKRNLAKVERDFTQTIIYTNDKTIVVGLGARNRTKRLTKVPKKYTDYYEAPPNSNELDERDFLRTNCSVSLPRLNLSGIVPFCLEHNLYSCHCKCQSDYMPRKHKEYSERSTHKYVKPVEAKRLYAPAKPKSDIVATQEIPPQEENSSEIIGYELNRRPKRKYQLSTKLTESAGENTCDAARVNPVPKYNRRRRYLNACKSDFIYNITDADIYKAQLKSMEKNQQQLEVDILKEYLIEVAQTWKANASGKNKRKQVLEVRKDDAPLAIQRRKKTTAVGQAPVAIAPVFDGEIIVDNTNVELLRKMGRKTMQDGYARLLPWKALTEAYRKGTVTIWSMIGQPSRLLMNKSDKKAPKNYIDIKDTTHTTEVILWLLRNKLPSMYEEDNVSFILRETKDNFEICGVCTKNLRDSLLPDTSMESGTDAVLEARGPITSFIHKDSQGKSQVLDMIKEKFKLQELMEESLGAYGDTSIKSDKLYMWAELPEIYGFYKWKMIYLNSDFAYLFFNNIKYSIKYTDLIAAGRISKASGYTVILRNKQMLDKYEHKLFGLHFDPNYVDRLFLGPYPKQFQEADVGTMRYINKTLVCTESFNKMRGKGDYKCGYWLIERPYNRVRRSAVESTIDLTNDDAVDDSGRRFPHPKIHNYSIMHNNEQVKIIDASPRKPEDFNRYLITNIPHFGYLGAYQYTNSSEIDVSWPFENKMLRFPNVTTATDFLQERFSTLLQPVPATFNIHIIVLTTIDITNSKPIDANVLSGYFICGEFGYYNILQITDEVCKEKIGKTKEQVLRMFAKKAQEIVRKRASTLCSLVNINTTTKDFDIIHVLDTATAEIKKLREQEHQYLTVKIQLSNKKKENAIKLFNMISLLPDDERARECTKFRSIISKTETIEIADSDEEGQQSPPSKDLLPPSKELSPPSKELSPPSKEISPSSKEISPSSKELSPPSKELSPPSKELSPPSKELATRPHPAGAIQGPAKRQSLLKPLIRVPIDQATSLLARGDTSAKEQGSSSSEDIKSNLPGRLIHGVKLIKTTTGNFVIVPDSSSPTKHRKQLSPGTKIIIKNNKIQRISKNADADQEVRPEGAATSKGVAGATESVVAVVEADPVTS